MLFAQLTAMSSYWCLLSTAALLALQLTNRLTSMRCTQLLLARTAPSSTSVKPWEAKLLLTLLATQVQQTLYTTQLLDKPIELSSLDQFLRVAWESTVETLY